MGTSLQWRKLEEFNTHMMMKQSQIDSHTDKCQQEMEALIHSLVKENITPLQLVQFLDKKQRLTLVENQIDVLVKTLSRMGDCKFGSEYMIENLQGNQAALKILCTAIGSEEENIFSISNYIIRKLSESPMARTFILDIVANLLQEASIREDSVICFRYIDIVAEVCGKHEALLQKCIERGLLNQLLAGLSGTDALFQLNILDTLPKLALSPSGVSFLFHSQVMGQLFRFVKDPLIGSNALRLVGELNVLACKIGLDPWKLHNNINLSEDFLELISQSLESTDELSIVAGMDSAAAFASTSMESMRKLLDHTALVRNWMEYGSSSKMQLKVACLGTLARLLASRTTLEKNPLAFVVEESSNLWTLHHELFLCLGRFNTKPTAMAYLMDCLRQPFEEIRVAVYQLLRALVHQGAPWGLETVLSHAGFIETLLNRSTESLSNVKEWKFAVLEAIHLSPFKSRVLGAYALPFCLLQIVSYFACM